MSSLQGAPSQKLKMNSSWRLVQVGLPWEVERVEGLVGSRLGTAPRVSRIEGGEVVILEMRSSERKVYVSCCIGRWACMIAAEVVKDLFLFGLDGG